MQKFIIFTLFSLFFVLIIFGKDEMEKGHKEKDTIKRAVMEYYHEGHVKSEPKLYDKILHDDWKIFYLNEKGKLEQADKETYMSWYDPDKNDSTLKWKTTFDYIDVSGHLASVKLEIKNQKFGYIDYFNLMKIDGKWWIVNKISRKL